MGISSNRTIATRNLVYIVNGEATRTPFSICIGEPYLLTEENCDIPFAGNAGGCVVSFDGLPEKSETVHGADTVQALELAIQMAEGYLRRLSNKKYDFYFDDGEPYFED